MPSSPLGSLTRTQSLPSLPATEQRPVLQRSASLPASDSGLRSRTASLRTPGAEAGAPPLAPRNQALKALGKHAFGALKHGAARVLQSTSRAMHNQISSHSGPASALANSYGLAGEMTRSLVKNEGTMAKTHLLGLRLAAKDLLHKTRTYDAGAIAQRLSWLKEQKHALQADKKEVLALGLGSQAPAHAPATRHASAPAAIGPNAIMVHTRKPKIAAAQAASAAVRHAVAGAYHKAKEGMHFIGARARTDAPVIAQAHRMAQASHSAKAALSFADASVQMKYARHYAIVAAREQAARPGPVPDAHAMPPYQSTPPLPVTTHRPATSEGVAP